MSTFMLHSRNAWNDYFPSVTTTNLNSRTYTSRQTHSATNVYVSNCLFRSISSTSDGGALYCTSMTYFLVESTSFFSCNTSSSNGGAIYFSNTNNGQCVLYGVCGFACCSAYYGQFAYIEVSNAASNKNYVNYSSNTHCINENSGSWYILFLYNGKICCPSVNISLNRCNAHIVRFAPFTETNSIICSCTYSSFADNIPTSHTCVRLITTGAKYEIKSCNILRNIQSSSTQGTICTAGNLMISDSCILENTATYIFHQTSSSYTITLSNCTVDSTSNNGYVTTKNKVTKSFILALNHMSTKNCHSEYDFAGILTPNIQLPSSSNEQMQCQTCKKFLHHSPLRDFFILTSVSLVIKLLLQ
jgi:hypothetical protein